MAKLEEMTPAGTREYGTGKQDICELTLTELTALLKEWGEPAYRAKQIYTWLHQKLAPDFLQMSNLSKGLRDRLSEHFYITVMEPVEVLVSKLDGTRKYVLRLRDGNIIEAVLMRYHHGNSVCVSSQVGCRMGCRFCASTLDGCVRGLTAAEMLAEIYAITRDTGERVSNVVIMGSGEPLDNFDETVRFIRMLSDENGLNISQRNITLSTCGLVPKIRELAELDLQITLALSLHAASQEVRETIMPVARAYPLREVLAACRMYFEKTGRRLTFEYSVVKGVNDTVQEAEKLAQLLKGMHGHVNLIPVNPIRERSYESPDRRTVEAFQAVLLCRGLSATIRREMGRDISSACGQLRRSYEKRNAEQED
ncbi:MAG: 23S rRNA (adenine(2503)-C(2))-methyltransferase RlmN [Eubacteriales bacterium]|nr:23S rRNA (adenine(2503)-C(2))-methyltransferase RlmN [Eubacteriales bacterium]